MDWSNPVGSVVQGGMGLLGSALNYKYNKALAAQQNQYNIDMWKMQAEYNSPQAQMQRFSEAGLNPNLIYGQGSNGNMSSAPEQVVPQAPELSKHMAKLGEAFNIEGLRTMIANRKKAQADAENAKTDAKRNAFELNAELNFGSKYTYDYNQGKYVLRPRNEDGSIDLVNPSAYYFNRILEGNYNRSYLLPYRSALLNSQKRYLEPQILMSQYEQRWQPYSFWIGQGAKGLSAIGSLIPKFKFGFGGSSMPTPRARTTTFY